MAKKYVVALTSEKVDFALLQSALVGDSAASPPPICHVVLPRVVSHFKRHFPEIQFISGSSLAEFESQHEHLSEAEILFFLDSPPSLLADIIPLMPKLRWIHSYFAGIDGICSQLSVIDSPADGGKLLERSDLLVTNAKGVFSSSLKEYVMAAIFHFAKQIPTLQKNKEEKKYDRFIMGEIRGSTVGFVGYGDIAREIASACKVFGMRCIALRKDGSKKDELLDAVFSAGDSGELEVYRQADFVVCSLPGTPQTRNSVSSAQFAAMKKKGVFISIGRGCVVDETALLEALTSGGIAGAALDVFQEEPLPVSSPLWGAPNLLLSAHNADWTENYSSDMTIRVFRANMEKFIRGAKTNAEMYTPVDCKRGY
ncbi:hypothetical protein Efla_004531 [Eimeria flavescens]